MRLVLVHGFTQTRRSWDPLVVDLARDHDVVALDAPGHGRSSEVQLDLVEGGAWLAAAGGRATYVGYSMGGRLCLHAALAAPDAVRGLVLISATGGMDDVGEREARRAADEALADRIERIGVPAFLDEWLAQPLFAGLSPAAQGRAERLENTAAGLASSLRLAGTGSQEPLWERLGRLTMPTLVVAGALDPKFVALGERLATAIPGAELAVVEGAGHTVHLERPAELLAVVRRWLDAHAESPSPTVSRRP